ncbi:MAG: hypothetical protein ACE5DK_13120, partial [Paracoccaceae bacterium]
MFWSALFAAPTGLADVWFAPAYWQPDHVFGPQFSIEGMLFSFGNGVILALIVWPLIAGKFRTGRICNRLKENYIRLVLTVAPGFVTFLVLWDGLAGPLPVMQASIAAFVALAAWLLLRGKLDARVGLAGSAMFALAYWVEILIWSFFDPDIAHFWSQDATYLANPLPFTGLPGDELLWAAFYGLLWPSIIALAVRAPDD